MKKEMNNKLYLSERTVINDNKSEKTNTFPFEISEDEEEYEEDDDIKTQSKKSSKRSSAFLSEDKESSVIKSLKELYGYDSNEGNFLFIL